MCTWLKILDLGISDTVQKTRRSMSENDCTIHHLWYLHDISTNTEQRRIKLVSQVQGWVNNHLQRCSYFFSVGCTTCCSRMSGRDTSVVVVEDWPLSVSSCVVVVPLTWLLSVCTKEEQQGVGWRCTRAWSTLKAFSTVFCHSWVPMNGLSGSKWLHKCNTWRRSGLLLLHVFCHSSSAVAKQGFHTVLKAFDEFQPWYTSSPQKTDHYLLLFLGACRKQSGEVKGMTTTLEMTNKG